MAVLPKARSGATPAVRVSKSRFTPLRSSRLPMATPTSASARELALLLQHSDDPIIDQQLLGGNTQSPAIKATRHCDPTIHIVVALCLIVFLLHTFIWLYKLYATRQEGTIKLREDDPERGRSRIPRVIVLDEKHFVDFVKPAAAVDL